VLQSRRITLTFLNDVVVVIVLVVEVEVDLMVHREVLGDGIEEEFRVDGRRVVHYVHIGVTVV
jgi:hypothetical protein